MEQNKKVLTLNNITSMIQIILGALFTLLCTIGIITEISNYISLGTLEDISTLWVGIILITLSLWSLLCGIKKRKLLKLFKSYTLRLSTDPTHSIDELAANTGTSIEAVKNNLNKMITREYFPTAYIDEKLNRIIFPNSLNLTNNLYD